MKASAAPQKEERLGDNLRKVLNIMALLDEEG
jgi:hypothetical protein